jgi:signal transduction histidine kinase
MLNAVEIVELLLVATGALVSSTLVLAQNRRVPVSWFNGPLSAWATAWSTWFTLTFLTLNLDLMGLNENIPIRIFLNVVKGWLLCLQMGFFAHGLLRLTRSRMPGWFLYLIPLAVLVSGSWLQFFSPELTFLKAIDSIVVLFLTANLAYHCLGFLILGRLEKELPPVAWRVLRPLRLTLPFSVLFLGVSLAAKLAQGPWIPRLYAWVLPMDLAHLLSPLAILLAAWRLRSVTIEVTRSTFQRIGLAACLFPVWLGVKILFPMSQADWVLSAGAILWAFLGALVPVWRPFWESVSRAFNYGMEREREVLVRLEARLLENTLPKDRFLQFTARALSRLLGCKVQMLAADDVRLAAFSESLAEGARQTFPPLLSLSDLTSRKEYQAMEELGAQLLMPVTDSVHRPSLAMVLALGAGRGTRGYPRGLKIRLRALQGALIQGLEARQFVVRRLEIERGRGESERLAMLGLLSASLAHEIKNPLSSIRNIVTAARRDAQEGSTLSRDLEVVGSEVDRLDGTVRRMLLFARERGSTEDVGATVEAVCGLLQLESRQRNRPLRLEGCGQKLSLDFPESDFKACLLNLVLNALEHSTGDVLVRVARDPIRVEVENPGEVPGDAKARLFRPLESRTGTGLGLWISRQRLREHGADLECVSEGGKTVFRMIWRNV